MIAKSEMESLIGQCDFELLRDAGLMVRVDAATIRAAETKEQIDGVWLKDIFNYGMVGDIGIYEIDTANAMINPNILRLFKAIEVSDFSLWAVNPATGDMARILAASMDEGMDWGIFFGGAPDSDWFSDEDKFALLVASRYAAIILTDATHTALNFERKASTK